MRLGLVVGLALAGVVSSALAQTAPGVSGKEIRIGQTMPYSGPASAYGSAGKTEASYFSMLNEKGGVNGRKIVFLTLDDAYSPPKTVEQTRKLVEQDEVFALVGSLGTSTNSAVQRYLNQKKIPQFFVATGADKWNDPKKFPWTIPLYASYSAEGRVAARYVLEEKPEAKIAILYQADDAGRDYVRGFKEGLGDKAATAIVKEIAYEVSDPTVDSQIIALKASGADVLFNMSTPKFAAQSIRKAAELGWKPLHYLSAISSSISTVLAPAGLENGVGIVTAIAKKTPGDPRWANDKGVSDYVAFMKKYHPGVDPTDGSSITGYNTAWLTEYVLSRMGEDLTRENMLKVVTSIRDLQLPLAPAGVTITITPDDYNTFDKLEIVRFDGKTWDPLRVVAATPAAPHARK